MKKITLRLFGIIGIIVFFPLFGFTFIDAQSIEKSAAGFIEWKLGIESEQKIDSLKIPNFGKLEKLLGNKAEAARAEAELKLENIKQQLKDSLPTFIAEEISKLKNPSCSCRVTGLKKLQEIQLQAINLESQIDSLKTFSHKKYMDIVSQLTQDIRIFLGANSIIFLLLFIVSILKPNAVTHLFVPSALLFTSTIICSYFYLFEQNWFYTIIYNDYMGYGFIIYLTIVFAFLVDITLNKGKITTEILNGILEGIGQSASVACC